MPAQDEDALPIRFVESLGTLGHELRNSLACIIAVTATMRSCDTGSEQQRRRLAMIARAARRMAHIVSTTIQCAQTAASPVALVPRRIDLRDACEEIIEEALAAQAVVIHLRPGDSQWGWWDPVAIAQVLSNLIGNAIVHGVEHEPITVDLAGRPGAVTVTVTNQGPVIPSDMLASIFQPWRHGLRPGHREHDSLGLGLHVVHRLVEAHGGTVTVDSSAERGTSFSVELPRGR